jgi:hypothetical protein
VERTATEAAKRKFSPEFMNRIDKVVVFHPLRPAQLEQVLDIEMNLVQRRVLDTARGQFVFRLTRPAREFLLREGTDIKYGARHLKRAIERNVVYPLANLLSTGQIMVGDILSIDWDPVTQQLSFARTGESALVPLVPTAPVLAAQAISAWGGRAIEIPAQANAREAQPPASASAPPSPAPVASRRRHDTQR